MFKFRSILTFYKLYILLYSPIAGCLASQLYFPSFDFLYFSHVLHFIQIFMLSNVKVLDFDNYAIYFLFGKTKSKNVLNPRSKLKFKVFCMNECPKQCSSGALKP